MEMKVRGRRKRGKPIREDSWTARMRDDIKEKGRKCSAMLHGGVCHRT